MILHHRFTQRIRRYVLATTIVGLATIGTAAQANFNTTRGFEVNGVDTADWTTGALINRVPSGGGTLHLPSSAGGFHAELANQPGTYGGAPGGGYGKAGMAHFGGDDSVYHGDFFQSVDVYINVNWPAVAGGVAESFWIDMTPYHADEDNYGAEHNFRVKALGNAVDIKVDGQTTPIAHITASGWYTFEMTWSKGATGDATVVSTLAVYDHSQTQVGNTTTVLATAPGGPFLSDDLKGNGYVWFTVWVNGGAGDLLAIDNMKTGPIFRYTVAPSDLGKTPTFPFAWDPDSVQPEWGSGAPTDYGQSSFAANVTKLGATAAQRYRTLRINFDTLFGRPVTIGEIEGYSYSTYKAVDANAVGAIDWRSTIYTKPTGPGTGDWAWYHNRIQADSFISYASAANVIAPANHWNLWSTSATANEFRFYDRNRFSSDSNPSSRNITWNEITTAPVTRTVAGSSVSYDYRNDVVWFVDLTLGANNGGGIGASQLDSVRILLKNGDYADVDLTSGGNPFGTNMLHLSATDASFFLKRTELCVIDLNVVNINPLTPVSGLQAMLNFSSTYFQAGSGQVGVVAGGGIWDQLLYNQWTGTGDLDVAVGVQLELPAGTTADGTAAVITLHPNAVDGITRMDFRPDPNQDPELTQTTLLIGVNGDTLPVTKTDSVNLFIDGTAPVLVDSITATEIHPYNASPVDVKNAAHVTMQGEVVITLEASDATAGLAGAPTIVLTNGVAVQTATYESEGPEGTFHYTWDVTAATAEGTWLATATATDKSGNATNRTFTLNVNGLQIVGQIELEGFVGTATTPAHTRNVTFVSNGGDKTWSLPLTNVSGNVFSYVLVDVPAGTTAISAKTASSLRSKLSGLTLDSYGQLTGVDFTGTAKLLAGDVNGTNSINIVDYSLFKTKWFTADATSDFNGDGAVNLTDYTLMKGNWFKVGSAQ